MKAKYPIILLIIIVLLGEIAKDDEPSNAWVSEEPSSPPSQIGKINPLDPVPQQEPVPEGTVGPGTIGDDVVVIEEDPKNDRSRYTGTAFSIDNRGLWVTARHVTDECDQLMLLRPYRRPLAVTGLAEHDGADVAMLQTDGGYDALNVNYDAPEYNQEGFHYGFPSGEPGNVYSRLVGRKTMKTVGFRNYRETIHVWAEYIRAPEIEGSLGGISGGPILNKNGEVVGIHVAGSVRRGRSFSSLPKNISDLLLENNVNVQDGGKAELDKTSLTDVGFTRVGDELRSDITVAKVVCRTD